MQKCIFNDTKTEYVIARNIVDSEIYEYYLGAFVYGKDKDGVQRVYTVSWSKEPDTTFSNLDYARERIKGIIKYAEEGDFCYSIFELKTSRTITDEYVKIKE